MTLDFTKVFEIIKYIAARYGVKVLFASFVEYLLYEIVQRGWLEKQQNIYAVGAMVLVAIGFFLFRDREMDKKVGVADPTLTTETPK